MLSIRARITCRAGETGMLLFSSLRPLHPSPISIPHSQDADSRLLPVLTTSRTRSMFTATSVAEAVLVARLMREMGQVSPGERRACAGGGHEGAKEGECGRLQNPGVVLGNRAHNVFIQWQCMAWALHIGWTDLQVCLRWSLQQSCMYTDVCAHAGNGQPRPSLDACMHAARPCAVQPGQVNGAQQDH